MDVPLEDCITSPEGRCHLPAHRQGRSGPLSSGPCGAGTLILVCEPGRLLTAFRIVSSYIHPKVFIYCLCWIYALVYCFLFVSLNVEDSHLINWTWEGFSYISHQWQNSSIFSSQFSCSKLSSSYQPCPLTFSLWLLLPCLPVTEDGDLSYRQLLFL